MLEYSTDSVPREANELLVLMTCCYCLNMGPRSHNYRGVRNYMLARILLTSLRVVRQKEKMVLVAVFSFCEDCFEPVLLPYVEGVLHFCESVLDWRPGCVCDVFWED